MVVYLLFSWSLSIPRCYTMYLLHRLCVPQVTIQISFSASIQLDYSHIAYTMCTISGNGCKTRVYRYRTLLKTLWLKKRIHIETYACSTEIKSNGLFKRNKISPITQVIKSIWYEILEFWTAQGKFSAVGYFN